MKRFNPGTAGIFSLIQNMTYQVSKVDQHPSLIQVHLDYLEAGANIIISSSYQVFDIFPYTIIV